MADPHAWKPPDSRESGEGGPARAPSYSEYLKLPGLLSLQKPLTVPAVHDEMLFIIVHQTHELWFKQMLCELTLLVTDVDAGRFTSGCRTVSRLTKIARLLSEHMSVLGTMPGYEFQRFRAALGTASGLESEQFRRLERLAGALPAEGSLGPGGDAPSTSVRQAFLRSVAREHPGLLELFPRDEELDTTELARALVGWLADPALAANRGLCQHLLEFDRQMVAWRQHHFELARQMIGGASGTGGSSGASYLRAVMDRRYFPELWPETGG
jgi:tryptophan 2,3-dioxygenase